MAISLISFSATWSWMWCQTVVKLSPRENDVIMTSQLLKHLYKTDSVSRNVVSKLPCSVTKCSPQSSSRDTSVSLNATQQSNCTVRRVHVSNLNLAQTTANFISQNATSTETTETSFPLLGSYWATVFRPVTGKWHHAQSHQHAGVCEALIRQTI